MSEQIRIGDEWYVAATSARAEESPKVIKSGDTFGMFDRFGDIRSWGPANKGYTTRTPASCRGSSCGWAASGHFSWARPSRKAPTC